MYYIYYGPAPRRHPFGIPFVKDFMCPYFFFPMGVAWSPGRRSAPGLSYVLYPI